MSTWNNDITESSDWLISNDPCLIELGSGWRIPTSTEWSNVDSSGNWNDLYSPWNSGLKLHTAGYLNYNNGSLCCHGSNGLYWSSMEHNSMYGWFLYFLSGDSFMYSIFFKAHGFSVRCLRD